MTDKLEQISIAVDAARTVSGLFRCPAQASACLLFAHGAGAGMSHPFMERMAVELGAHGIATLRYQFPFMEQGTKKPDPPAIAHATVRAASAAATRLVPALPLLAGGKSFGGRMTSQAQAASPLPGVRGLAFFAFPLHPAGRPSTERAKHLFDVAIPMLSLQGTRDALAEADLLLALAQQLGALATLKMLDHADHAFHVLVRSGRTDQEVRQELVNAFMNWVSECS